VTDAEFTALADVLHKVAQNASLSTGNGEAVFTMTVDADGQGAAVWAALAVVRGVVHGAGAPWDGWEPCAAVQVTPTGLVTC
jgi:hypothetical protein